MTDTDIANRLKHLEPEALDEIMATIDMPQDLRPPSELTHARRWPQVLSYAQKYSKIDILRSTLNNDADKPKWCLTYVDQQGTVAHKERVFTSPYRIGREFGHLIIGTGTVSRRHMELTPLTDRKLQIRDLGSTYGEIVVTGLSTSSFPWTTGGYRRYLLAEHFFVAVSTRGLEWEHDIDVTHLSSSCETTITERALIFFPAGILLIVCAAARTSKPHMIGAMPGQPLKQSILYKTTHKFDGFWRLFNFLGCDVIDIEQMAEINGIKVAVPLGEAGVFTTPIIFGRSKTLTGREFYESLIFNHLQSRADFRYLDFYVMMFEDQYIQPFTGALVHMFDSIRLIQMPIKHEGCIRNFLELIQDAVAGISTVKPHIRQILDLIDDETRHDKRMNADAGKTTTNMSQAQSEDVREVAGQKLEMQRLAANRTIALAVKNLAKHAGAEESDIVHFLELCSEQNSRK